MRPQLFLFHFAGGNSYSFGFLKEFLPEVEFTPLELPGRGRRMDEAFAADFDTAAADICALLLKNLKSPLFAIYGHSMGALLALKVAELLESEGINPRYLIVTGYSGPGNIVRKRHLMTDEQFIRELREMGGMPLEILENEDMFRFFGPILKADFELVEKYDYRSIRPVRTPIYAIMGSSEEGVRRIDNWKKYALSTFGHEIMDGGHFFIHAHAEKLASVIKRHLFS